MIYPSLSLNVCMVYHGDWRLSLGPTNITLGLSELPPSFAIPSPCPDFQKGAIEGSQAIAYTTRLDFDYSDGESRWKMFKFRPKKKGLLGWVERCHYYQPSIDYGITSVATGAVSGGLM